MRSGYLQYVLRAARVGVSDDLDKNDDLMKPNDAKMT